MDEHTAETKTIELAIEIAAEADAVWRAISEGEELSRWFAPSARVEPGVDGSVWLSWGEGVEATATIEVWEAGRRLRTRQPMGGDLDPCFVDYRIEGRGGSTLLRLVHSGFMATDDWSEYIDTLESGWRYFLFNLKHYLERHHGVPRRMVSRRRATTWPRPEAWDRLFGPGGVASTALPAVAGAPLTLWSGDEGLVGRANHPIHLTARLPSLNDALLLVELEPGGDRYHVGVWLSLYGLPDERADALQRSLGEALDRSLEA